MPLQCLPQSTIKLIGSSQVITSVSVAVKELVENSLDAGASSIEVKLENHGMDKIEVRDDGCGINKNDVSVLCKKSYTSKISSFEDLNSLRSYGFRGEALNALCAVSKLSITTKTDQDDLACTYYFDNSGSIKDSKPSHINKGTIIIAEGLFRNLPVRRQYLTNGRRRSDEIKKVEATVKCLAIVHPRLRLTFTHNKFLIWQKNSVSNLKQSLAQAIPPTIISQLDSFNFSDSEILLEMTGLLPRKDCNVSVTCFSNRDDSSYLFINGRPVRHKELEKAVESELFQYFGHYIPPNKYLLWLLSIKLAPDGLDVNLEPNKTKLIIKDLDYLLEKLKAQFVKYYTGKEENPDVKTPIDIKISKRKLETDENEINNSQENIKIPKITELSNNSDQESSICDNKNECLPEKNSDNTLQEIVDLKTLSTSDNNMDSNISIGTLNSQELDELELILATSSQSSIVVTPDINNSCSNEYSSSQELNSDQDNQICDTKRSNLCSKTTDVNNSFDCFGSADNPPSQVNQLNCSNSCAYSNRNDNISNFLDGLPVSQYDEKSDDSSKYINKEIDSFNEDCSKRTDESTKGVTLNIDNITLSQWSRGQILDSSEVPIIVKAGDTINTANNNEDVSCLDNVETTMISKTVINSSHVDNNNSSQEDSENMTSFTKFSNEMRTKIIQNQSGMTFNRVASELTSKWRNLADSEKDEEVLPKKPFENKVFPPESKLKQTTIKPITTAIPTKGLKKVKYDKVFDTSISINELEHDTNTYSSENNLVNIIGKLNDDLYLFRSDNGISILSSSRLIESINFYKNMSNMIVPLKVLEKNISVKSEEIGDKNWHTLQCLETSVDLRNNTVIVANELISKNGFRIEVIDGINGKHFEITDVPTHVSYYGLNDLKEILELIDKHGTGGNLLHCRPLKISSYIRSETIRNCSSPVQFDSKGRDSMFHFWIKNVRNIYPNCPHHKPVTKELYTFEESENEKT